MVFFYMMNLIRNELVSRGFSIVHESERIVVLDNPRDTRRVLLSLSGRWQVFERSAFNRWRKTGEGSNLLTLFNGFR